MIVNVIIENNKSTFSLSSRFNQFKEITKKFVNKVRTTISLNTVIF